MRTWIAKRKWIALASGVIFIAIIATVSACSVWGQDSSLPPSAVMRTYYVSGDGLYRMSFPNTWKIKQLEVKNTSSTTEFEDKTENFALLVEPFTYESTNSFPSILQSLMSASVFKDSKVSPDIGHQTYRSGNWLVVTGTTTVSGVASNAVLYGTVHNGVTVIVVSLAPATTAGREQTVHFLPMMSSLSFLK